MADPAVAELIDRFHLVPKLRRQHWQQVVIGMVLTVATVAYNLVTPPAVPRWSTPLAAALAVLLILGGAGWLWWRAAAVRLPAHEPAPNAREATLRLAERIGRIGNAWLSWTIAGTLLSAVATLARLRFDGGPETLVLWISLLPAIGLLAHGIANVPTRERLLAAV